MTTNIRKSVALHAAIAAAGFFASGHAGGAAAPITPFILMVYCSGGWDQTMVFDDKTTSVFAAKEPGAVAANGAGSIPYVDHPARPSVRAFFDTYGGNAVIVNGLSVGSMVNRYQVRNALAATPPGKLRPVDWLSFYTSSLNPVLDIPHAVIDAPYIPGDYTDVATRLTAETMGQYGKPNPGADPLGNTGEKALAKFRATAYGTLYNAAGDSLDGEKYRALYYAASREGLIEARLAAALTAIGPQGSDSAFVRNGKLAVELFAAGASQTATVQAGGDLAWDTRTDHYAKASVLFENLFSGLNSILSYAAAKGVAGRTIVIVVSEGGRNPQLNAQGGKGPWPYTSALLWGPGLAGGSAYGLTDAALRGLRIDPLFGGQTGNSVATLTMANVMAALYVKTNVPTKLILPNTVPLSLILSSERAPGGTP